ncbi:MAG TPA: GAF domain-containing protein [Chloroflexi bacterium]|nr:GAF domain-containing protein [Chloroflexota bacterium]
MLQPQNSQTKTDVTTRLKIRVRELSIMHEIARAVTSTLDLQSVLNRIVEAAVYLTNAEEGFIMLVDEQSKDLYLRAGKGLGDKAAKVMNMSVKDSFAEQVINTGKPLRMGGGQKSDTFKVKTGYLVKSILNVPIKGQGRVLGVLSVDHAIASHKTFSDYDVSLLSNLAEYAAIAIENARRYGEASSRADELAQVLEEIGVAPSAPTREADQEALEKFNKALRNQRQEVSGAQAKINQLAQELRLKAEGVEELAYRVGLWNEEVENLIPQLDWIAQTGLARIATGPLGELPSPDTEIALTIKIILANTGDGILLCDAKGKILEANQRARHILDRGPGDMPGSDLPSLAPSDTRWEHLIGSLRLALALGSKQKTPPPASSATLYLGEKIIKVTLSPTGKRNKNSVAIVAILKDVTAETEGWRARDEAMNAISERLRTPMSTVSSYSDLLLSESVGLITTDQRRYLKRIRQAVDKMEAKLLESISQPSPPLPPAIALEPSPQLDVSAAIEEAIETAQQDLKDTGVQLETNMLSLLPAVQIAPEQVTKIVCDLLSRASIHAKTDDTIKLTTIVREENDQPAYLEVVINNQTPHPNDIEAIENDADLHAIAKAVAYQGGRVWTDIDYAGRWGISLLLPTLV